VAEARAAIERAPEANVVKVLPHAVASYEQMVKELPGMLNKDPDRAREILRRLLGVVKLVREKGGLFAEFSMSPGQLLGLAAGSVGSGAGFDACLEVRLMPVWRCVLGSGVGIGLPH
jgi:hypothetical protein